MKAPLLRGPAKPEASRLRLTVAGGLVLLALWGCDKAPPEVPSPPAPLPATVAGTESEPDTSVPSASSVFLPAAPAAAASADVAAGRSNKTMSRTQESTAMPMAGQNNDHSAPLAPAKAASKP